MILAVTGRLFTTESLLSPLTKIYYTIHCISNISPLVSIVLMWAFIGFILTWILQFWRNTCMLICSIVSDSLWPMDCGPPGSFIYGIFQARILEGMGNHSLFQGIFLTQGWNPGLLHQRQMPYHLTCIGFILIWISQFWRNTYIITTF